MLYPIQIAYPFAPGQFVSPVIEGVSTQTDIKCRWPDGSVKHAIFSFVVDGDAVPVFNIVNGVSTQGGGAIFPVDAVMELYQYPTLDTLRVAIAAQALVDENKFKTWVHGPICTVLGVADESGGHDIFYAQTVTPSFRPRFIIRYWHTLGYADIQFVGENANSQALEEHAYSLRLKIDGQMKYERAGIVHWRNSRWTKRFYGGPRARIKHTLKYLSEPAFVPNYDQSVELSESGIVQYYSNYTINPHDFLDRGSGPMFGLWTKASPTGGAQPAIGPYPTASVMKLYSSDKRVDEMLFDGNDLYANYPFHFREGRTDKTHYGEPLRITDRPTLSLGEIHYDGTKIEDRVQPTGDEATNGGGSGPNFVVDIAHQAAAFYFQYLTTGDLFALEEMEFLASYTAAHNNGAAQNLSNGNNGRGPTGTEGCLTGQGGGATIRGQAWGIRNRAELAFILPDDHPAKAYYAKLIDDALAIWEGQKGILGNFQNDPRTINHAQAGLINLWDWGTHWPNINALNFWEDGGPAFVQPEVDPTKASRALSGWEPHFMAYALGRLVELGFDRAKPLLEHQRICVAARVANLGGWTGSNRIATANINGALFTTWAQVRDAYKGDEMAVYQNGLGNSDHGYSRIAAVAAALVGDKAGFQWHQNHGQADPSLWSGNPKWRILPR